MSDGPSHFGAAIDDCPLGLLARWGTSIVAEAALEGWARKWAKRLSCVGGMGYYEAFDMLKSAALGLASLPGPSSL